MPQLGFGRLDTLTSLVQSAAMARWLVGFALASLAAFGCSWGITPKLGSNSTLDERENKTFLVDAMCGFGVLGGPNGDTWMSTEAENNWWSPDPSWTAAIPSDGDDAGYVKLRLSLSDDGRVLTASLKGHDATYYPWESGPLPPEFMCV